MAATIFSRKKFVFAWWIYFIACCIVHMLVKIQLGGEAEKYIDDANRIVHGEPLRNGIYGSFYIVYSLIVALLTKLSMSLESMVTLQIILSFLAAMAFYQLVFRATKNEKLSFVFFIGYLLCFPIQKWNFFLYSEGMHTSLLVIAVYYFDRFLNSFSIKTFLAALAMMLLVLFSRPVGLVFLFAAGIALLFYCYRMKKMVWFSVVVIVGISALIGLANSPAVTFINPDSLKRMEVICQVPENSADTSYTEFNNAGLGKVFSVIKNDIGVGNFLRNGIKKLSCFFGMYRSYYSWKSNGLLLLYWIFYPLALLGIFIRTRDGSKNLKWLSLAYIITTTLLIFITCDDWANRFISPVFPFIMILAAIGVSGISRKTISDSSI